MASSRGCIYRCSRFTRCLQVLVSSILTVTTQFTYINAMASISGYQSMWIIFYLHQTWRLLYTPLRPSWPLTSNYRIWADFIYPWYDTHLQSHCAFHSALSTWLHRVYFGTFPDDWLQPGPPHWHWPQQWLWLWLWLCTWVQWWWWWWAGPCLWFKYEPTFDIHPMVINPEETRN